MATPCERFVAVFIERKYGENWVNSFSLKFSLINLNILSEQLKVHVLIVWSVNLAFGYIPLKKF